MIGALFNPVEDTLISVVDSDLTELKSVSYGCFIGATNMNNGSKTSDLTPSQIAGWYRAQAARYIERAEEIERDFGVLRPTQVRLVNAQLIEAKPTMNLAVPTPDRIKEAMAGRKLRAADIAAELSVSVEMLKPVLTTANGFVIGNRGWVGVKEESP